MRRENMNRLVEAEQAFHMGNALAMQGKLDQAVTHYERVLALMPDLAEAHSNLGLALAMQGKFDQAITHYERALALMPDYAEAHNNLGMALATQGKLDQAITHYERALALKPDSAETHSNLGMALATQGKLDQAIAYYVRALVLMPDLAKAHNNLGVALAAQGKLDQAIAHYERALALMPDYAEAHSNLLLTLNYTSDKDSTAVYSAHVEFAKRLEAPWVTLIQAHVNDRSLGRCLKVGYVSSDMRMHSVCHFIEPVLVNHNRDRFEIFCYSNNPREDEITERLKSYVDLWRGIIGVSDELVAQQIRADQIDILIDLNGHTALNRLPVFARKPAPIQVTWLGYPNTTGLSAMDYRITDGFADPVGMTEHIHTEKLARLPHCFSCYEPPRDAPEVSELPARKKGYITFGSFNNLAKITPEVMAIWAKILHAVPDSRLTLKNSGLGAKAMQQAVREIFVKWGVALERLELLGPDRFQKAHLEQYRNIDIGLDPFPYNGTTTNCEALWMGVPVVTLAGRTHAGRVGVSQMSNLGLTGLIGATPQKYIDAALLLASDLDYLSALRMELRARMAASPLMDGPRFTNNLEQAYLFMWKNWCLKNG